MIISEKQIMQLINIAKDFLIFGKEDNYPLGYRDDVIALLEILSQQSEELKEIKTVMVRGEPRELSEFDNE
jgi:hypothetical protein